MLEFQRFFCCDEEAGHPRNSVPLFTLLLMVVLCDIGGDKLLFIMNYFPIIHSMVGSSAERYADAVLPTAS